MSRKKKMRGYVKRFLTILLTLALIVSLTPSLGALTGGTLGAQDAYAAQEITIQGREVTVSDLIKSTEEGGYGLTSEDTLIVGFGTTIVVDTDFSINQIKPLTTGPSLTIKGDGALTVANGINLASGSLCVQSGELFVSGPYSGGNPYAGIIANSVVMEGGTINISFDGPTGTDLSGFRTYHFTMNDGQVTVDISGSGSSTVSGIYSDLSSANASIKKGTLDIDVENTSGHAYGIFNNSTGYVFEIDSGTADIDVRRTDSESSAADAGGIYGMGNDIYVKGGSLFVDITNAGQNVTGITGDYFNISGGTLEVRAVTSKEGRKGYGIRTDNDASFEMSGGDVTVVGKTNSSSSGEGIGIRYTNSDASKRMDISGGTLAVTGTSNGIYVYNNTENELSVQNQIYGTAKVTTDSYQEGIYGVRDAGWKIFGEAQLTATSNERYGLYTDGPLLFGGTSVGVLETRGSWTRGVYADGGITIEDTLEIANPSGGKISTDKKTIVDASDTNAKKVGIQPKDVVKANVLFFDESTGRKITSSSMMVYKNDGPWQAGGEDPVRFSVGKEAPFTLTAGISTSGEYGTEYNDYEFVGWYKNGYPGTSPISTNTTTPAQSITADTWYYAVFAPPKTEIKTFTLTSDKEPLAGMTRNDKPTVTIAEKGVTITGVAWIDMDGHHLAEDYVFTSGDGVMLMIDYSVDKAYKLSGDIESNTTLNGKSFTGVHDVPDTAVYVYYTIPYDISGAEVSGIKDKPYNGSAQGQDPTVKMNVGGSMVTLTNGTDYTLSYDKNKDIGTATVTITGKGNYTGSITKTFKITNPLVAKSFVLGGNTMNFKQNTCTSIRLPSIARPYQLSLTARFDKQMLIQWTDCKKLGADIDGYLVMRRVGSEKAYTQFVTVPASRNYYYDNSITKANTNYYYIVLAYKKGPGGAYIVSSDSMSVVGLRYDSTRINPHECPASGVSAALQAKFGMPTINAKNITLKVGQTYDLKLTYPKLSFSTWTRWRSDKSSIATVNSTGKVTAKSKGTVLISGRTPNGRDVRCTVTVVAP